MGGGHHIYIYWKRKWKLLFLWCRVQAYRQPYRVPSYLNSRSMGYVSIGCIEPSSHYLGNWSPVGINREDDESRTRQFNLEPIALPWMEDISHLKNRVYHIMGTLRSPSTLAKRCHGP